MLFHKLRNVLMLELPEIEEVILFSSNCHLHLLHKIIRGFK